MAKKQFHKSKEQIIWEKQQKKHKEVMDKFINEQLMPFMDKNTKNLEEAQFLMESTKVAIDQAFKNKAREMTVNDLKLKEQLEKAKNPDLVQKHMAIMDILGEQKIEDAIKLCDGLFNEVNRVLVQSLKDKKISDFTANE